MECRICGTHLLILLKFCYLEIASQLSYLIPSRKQRHVVGIDKYLFVEKVRKEKVKLVLNINFVKYDWEKKFYSLLLYLR
jgi:hypothetical protein